MHQTYKKLKDEGYKITPARKEIIRILFENKKALTIAGIHEKIKSKNLNTVTLYRNLDLFLNLKIVHHVSWSNGYRLCRKLEEKGSHQFLICQKCKNVTEYVEKKCCSNISDKIAKENNFTCQFHINEAIGICENCSD